MAGEPSRNDVNIPLLMTTSAAGVILLLVIVIGVQAWFQHEQNKEWDRKVLKTQNAVLERLYTEQTAHLRGGRWADADRQWATIGIERAMDLVVKRYAEGRAAADAADAVDGQG